MKLLYLGNKLSKHGINATTAETLSVKFAESGYEVVSVSDKRLFFWRLLAMVWACIFERNISYIIIDTYSTKAFWYAFLCGLIAKMRGVKYIPFLHGGDLPNRLKQSPRLCRLLFSSAYINVAPSNYLKSQFEAFGYSNVVFIPNTFDIDSYEFRPRKKFYPKLLWVRAFSKIYNPKMAVDVLCELQKKYPDAALCMVGPEKDGSLAETQSYAMAKNVSVTFTGRLDKNDWITLSQAYDIFINTTHFDNTPVSVMEAMALGLPVVTTNVGGIPFLLDDGTDGMLVPDGDAPAMVAAIEKLIQDAEQATLLAENARIKAETWDWQRVKQQWDALLR